MENIGILHPGEMGISIAASALNSGRVVLWASQGRSPQTLERSKSYTLVDAHTIENLCQTCSILISVCPPHAAAEVSQQVVTASFKGLYVDANAISPQRTTDIAEMMAGHGITFVDGGIIGGPAWEVNKTFLFLSGKESQKVADCFSAGPLRTEVIGDQIGQASALKMCYSAYTKGRSALLCAILGSAETLGVRDILEKQWSIDDPDFAEQTTQRVRRVTAKAWRFEAEMQEIAATFGGAGMPKGFHLAAADIYARLAGFKGRETIPELAEVLSALHESKEPNNPD